MIDAPERVWVETADKGPRNAYLHCGSWPGDRVEYIRADLSQAAVEVALREAAAVAGLAESAAKKAYSDNGEERHSGMASAGAVIGRRILALIPDTGALDRALEKAREEGRRELSDRIEALEAKLAKAVEALQGLVPILCEGFEDGCGKLSRHDCAACEGYATLAELTSSEAAYNEVKGGNDE